MSATTMSATRWRGLTIGLLVTAGVLPEPAGAQAATRDPPGSDWPSYNRTVQGDRYSPLDQINTSNVAGLRAVCTYDLRDTLSFQTGPLVIGGVMYFTTDSSTYAIDATTCALRWRRGTGQPLTDLRVNRGAAYESGRLFRGVGPGRVHALDAATGQVIWDVALPGFTPGASITMAASAWNGLVFIGNAGGDNYGVTGNVYALDQRDGRLVWRFNTVPDTGAAVKSWGNPPGVPRTGGAFWTSFGIDPGQGVLYVPAGNPAPDFVPELRPGLNLYTNSVIALDAKTGRMLGYYQLVRNDYHDWDVAAGPVIVTTRAGRPLIASANKDGLLSGLDRSRVGSATDPGNAFRLRYQSATTTRANVDGHFIPGVPVRFCPGVRGGTEWNGPAYHPGLNLIFTGAVDRCTILTQVDPDSLGGKPGQPWAGGLPPEIFGADEDSANWRGWITAFDADSGTVRWKHETPLPNVSGITPTAGGVLFAGELTGDVVALDAATGVVLWRHATGNGIGGGVITYSAGGKQYVAVAAGLKSYNWPAPVESNRIIVYALP